MHCHTDRSDGQLSPEELVVYSNRGGLRVGAFTDHDRLPSPEFLTGVLPYISSLETLWVSGIEINARISKDPSDFRRIHILGLGVDPSSEALQDHCENVEEMKYVRMSQIVDNLKRVGFTIPKKFHKKISARESFSLRYLVTGLTKVEQNQNWLDNIVRLNLDHGLCHLDELQYEKLVSADRSKDYAQKFYALFAGDSPVYPEVVFAEEHFTTIAEVVEMIHDAGGIAVVAHWGRDKSALPYGALDRLCAERQFDGLETIYDCRKKRIPPTSDEKLLENLVLKYGLVYSGGADIHTLKGLRSFCLGDSLEHYRLRTNGILKQLIEKGGLNTDFIYRAIDSSVEP